MSLFKRKEKKENETETVVVCPYCGGINTIKHNEEVDPGYSTEECTQCGHVEFHDFGVVQTKEKGD